MPYLLYPAAPTSCYFILSLRGVCRSDVFLPLTRLASPTTGPQRKSIHRGVMASPHHSALLDRLLSWIERRHLTSDEKVPGRATQSTALGRRPLTFIMTYCGVGSTPWFIRPESGCERRPGSFFPLTQSPVMIQTGPRSVRLVYGHLLRHTLSVSAAECGDIWFYYVDQRAHRA